MIGVLMDDTDPLVTVMKVEKAPQETYADIGGLDSQIQEIKVEVTEAELFPVFTFHIICGLFYVFIMLTWFLHAGVG